MRVNIRLILVIIAVLTLAAITGKTQTTGTDPGLPDTLVIDSVIILSAGTAIVPIFLTNDQPLAGIEISITQNSPDLVIDSFSFAGSRTEYVSIKGWLKNSGVMTIYVMPYNSDALITAGNGSIGSLYFSVAPAITPQMIIIDSNTFSSGDLVYSTTLSDANAQSFKPQFTKGFLDLQLSNCCIGVRGNSNGDPEEKVNIADIAYVTSYLFGIPAGPAPSCPDEGNVNGDPEGKVNISDLTFLINYLFGGGPPPASCP